MGASEWSYRTSYQEDIGAALQQLRWTAYRGGDYYKQLPDPSLGLTEEEFRATLPGGGDDCDVGTIQLEEWRKARMRPMVVDPDTLLASQPDSGTHSIIDMAAGVSASPDYFTVSPLTNEQLLRIFDTLTPTADQVVASVDRILEERRSWHGVYVVSYDGSTPSELHFLGFSGD